MMRKLLFLMGMTAVLVHAGTAAAQTQFDITGEIEAGTCEWAVGDDNKTVEFDPIDASVLNANGSGGFKTFTLALQNCAPALSLAVVGFSGIVDSNDPLRNKNRGTAQGTAVEFEWADGTTIGANNTNNIRAFPIVGNGVTIGLRAGYWRTGSVTAGTVDAEVTVSTVYQ